MFSDLFKISDMMVFVCWRPGMTSVLNLQFRYIVMHIFFEVTDLISGIKQLVVVSLLPFSGLSNEIVNRTFLFFEEY